MRTDEIKLTRLQVLKLSGFLLCQGRAKSVAVKQFTTAHGVRTTYVRSSTQSRWRWLHYDGRLTKGGKEDPLAQRLRAYRSSFL